MTAYWQTTVTNALTLCAAADRVRVLAMQTPMNCGVGLVDDVIKAFSHDPGGSDG